SPKAQRKMADRRYRNSKGRTANCTYRRYWTVNREIVAYAMSRRADSEMVKEMLEKAAPV
ncbi:hypothetical protein NEISICOT_03485, partial [Neisseria sicca ATCC 29256]